MLSPIAAAGPKPPHRAARLVRLSRGGAGARARRHRVAIADHNSARVCARGPWFANRAVVRGSATAASCHGLVRAGMCIVRLWAPPGCMPLARPRLTGYAAGRVRVLSCVQAELFGAPPPHRRFRCSGSLELGPAGSTLCGVARPGTCVWAPMRGRHPRPNVDRALLHVLTERPPDRSNDLVPRNCMQLPSSAWPRGNWDST